MKHLLTLLCSTLLLLSGCDEEDWDKATGKDSKTDKDEAVVERAFSTNNQKVTSGLLLTVEDLEPTEAITDIPVDDILIVLESADFLKEPFYSDYDLQDKDCMLEVFRQNVVAEQIDSFFVFTGDLDFSACEQNNPSEYRVQLFYKIGCYDTVIPEDGDFDIFSIEDYLVSQGCKSINLIRQEILNYRLESLNDSELKTWSFETKSVTGSAPDSWCSIEITDEEVRFHNCNHYVNDIFVESIIDSGSDPIENRYVSKFTLEPTTPLAIFFNNYSESENFYDSGQIQGTVNNWSVTIDINESHTPSISGTNGEISFSNGQ